MGKVASALTGLQVREYSFIKFDSSEQTVFSYARSEFWSSIKLLWKHFCTLKQMIEFLALIPLTIKALYKESNKDEGNCYSIFQRFLTFFFTWITEVSLLFDGSINVQFHSDLPICTICMMLWTWKLCAEKYFLFFICEVFWERPVKRHFSLVRSQ